MAIGYSAQDDVDRLTHDPAFRTAVWNRTGDRVIHERRANQAPQFRPLAMMAPDRTNVIALRDESHQPILRRIADAGNDKRGRQATIDLDSFPIEAHGKQRGSSYDDHYG